MHCSNSLYEQDEDKNMKCNLYDQVSHWWQLQKIKDINMVTLKIRDPALKKKLEKEELLAVK